MTNPSPELTTALAVFLTAAAAALRYWLAARRRNAGAPQQPDGQQPSTLSTGSDKTA
jgi:hypothetical protein